VAGVAGEQTLSDLTVSWLTRFIQQQLQLYPVTSLETFTAEELTVVNKLIVQDLVDFQGYKTLRFVGASGQPAYSNSWVSYGAPYANGSFLLGPDNFVRLHGTIKNGTLGSSAFTLPPGYRPSATIPFLVLSNGAAGRVDVGADGTVTPLSPSSNLSVVLDQIIFQAKPAS
jgi:hypothetical protein